VNNDVNYSSKYPEIQSKCNYKQLNRFRILFAYPKRLNPFRNRFRLTYTVFLTDATVNQ